MEFKNSFFVLLISLLLVAGFFVVPRRGANLSVRNLALLDPSGSVTVLLGGPIIKITYCTCSKVFGITVGPPVGGNFIYQKGVTTVYQLGMLIPKSWVLGLAVGKMACMQIAGTGCVPDPSIPFGALMKIVGTSAPL